MVGCMDKLQNLSLEMLLRPLFSRILGSGKEAVFHWWMQRITAVVLVPIVIWFAFAVAMLGGADYQTVVGWLQSPVVTILLILFIVATFYHIKLGMEVIIEDYVRGWQKTASLILSDLVCVVSTLVGVIALLKITL